MRAHLILAATFALSGTGAVQAQSDSNKYFWPAFQKQVSFKAKSHAIRGSITMKPGQTRTVAGQSYRELDLTTEPARLPGVAKSILMRADQNGLYLRYSADPDLPEILALSLPAEAGKSWQTHDRRGKPSRRVIESVAKCDIKGQLFEQCVRVAFDTNGGKAVAFYAPWFGEIVNSRKNGFLRRTINSAVK